MRQLFGILAFVFCLVSATFAWAESGLGVSEASVGTSIENRELQGTAESFSPDVGTVWCLTRITGGGGEGDTVKHRWFHGDNLMAEVELPVRSSSWRTYSSKKILPEWTGDWSVEITDPEGTVLETVKFSIEEQQEEEVTEPEGGGESAGE